jgi:TolC family type I secretion outer membrane protein
MATTLQEDISKVLDTNPIVLERLSNYKSSTQDLKIANARNLPTLDFNAGVGFEATDTSNSGFPDRTSLGYYETSLVFMQNIFDGYATTHEIDYQKAKILASAYNFVEKSNQIAFEMTYTYLELLKQKELLEVAKENVIINADILSKVQALYKSGLTKKSEMKKIESSLSLAKSNLVVQQNNLLDWAFKYYKILGFKPNLQLMKKPVITTLLPKTLDEAVNYTLQNNPALKVSNYNIKASKSLLKQNNSNLYPKIDFKISQDLDRNINGINNDRNNFRAGLVLSYNIYKGGIDEANKQKFINKINQDIYIKRDLKRQLKQDINLSWAANKMLKKQLKELYIYRDFSKNTLDLYQEEYNLGRRSLLDLLSTQNDLINSKSQIIRTSYDYLFSKYRVLNAMGLLVPSILGKDYTYSSKVGLDENSIAYVDEEIIQEENQKVKPLKSTPIQKCDKGSLEDVLLDRCKPKENNKNQIIPKKQKTRKKYIVEKEPTTKVVPSKMTTLTKTKKDTIKKAQHRFVVGTFKYKDGAVQRAKLFNNYQTKIKKYGKFNKVYVFTDATNSYKSDLNKIKNIVPDAWYDKTIYTNKKIKTKIAKVEIAKVEKPKIINKTKTINKPVVKTISKTKPSKIVKNTVKPKIKKPTKYHRYMVGSFDRIEDAKEIVKKYSAYKSKIVNRTYYYEVYLYTTTAKPYNYELAKLSRTNPDTWYNGIYSYNQ